MWERTCRDCGQSEIDLGPNVYFEGAYQSYSCWNCYKAQVNSSQDALGEQTEGKEPQEA